MRLPIQCQRLIQESHWIYAKTMPQSPHFYIVRNEQNDEDFATLAEIIQQRGFPARFGEDGQAYVYFEYDGYLYWTMGNRIPDTTIINRCSTFLYDKVETRDGIVLERNQAQDDIDKFICHEENIQKVGNLNSDWVSFSNEEREFVKERNEFFAKNITKMQLESSSICIIPGRTPKPGDEVMQRLTLNQRGHVWLTKYECCGEYWYDQKLVYKIQFHIPSFAVHEIFAEIREALSGDYRSGQYCDDHAGWYLVLTNENGERWFSEGSPASFKLKTKKGRLSTGLRQLFGRQDLFLFDDHTGPKPGELIFYNVNFSDGGKEYCYLADEDIYEEGDLVIVPAGEDNQEERATVISVQYLTPEQAPFPIERLKKILRKA